MKNPTNMLKMANAYKTFSQNHPKFASFMQAAQAQGIREGAVIEVSITNPGEEPLVSNLRVQQSDLELLQGMKDMA